VAFTHYAGIAGNAAMTPYLEGMMNVIIGLCLGAAAAVALVIMWRMVARLRDEMQSQDNSPVEKQTRGDDAADGFKGRNTRPH
jgi:hypothetical protein